MGRKSKTRQRGFTLLEVFVAVIAVAVFCAALYVVALLVANLILG